MHSTNVNSLILSSPLPLDQNPAAVYVASLGGPYSSGGRKQAQALRDIAAYLGSDPTTLNWSALRYQHTAMIRARLAASFAPATANRMLSALRQTLKHAWLLGQMSVDDYLKAVELEAVTGQTLPAGRELSIDEIASLLTACANSENRLAGIRDRAIIALMYTAGPRREEVVSLNLADYDPQTGKLIITGKRNKQRTAYVINGAAKALGEWLAVRGEKPGPLFVEVDKWERIYTDTMTPQAVYNMLRKRAKQAGIQNFSPHDMRRTFISHLLDAGADISTVSKMAGHENVKTTARYDRRPEDAKRQAAALLHIPI